jgi:hypothetical protein
MMECSGGCGSTENNCAAVLAFRGCGIALSEIMQDEKPARQCWHPKFVMPIFQFLYLRGSEIT